MAHFYKNDTTTAGEALIAEAIAGGGVFTPTRIVIGAGDIPEGTQPEDMTALVLQKMSLPINKKKKTEGESAAIIGAAFTNQEVTEGFYFKEIGVYAKVVYPDETESEEILYSYGNAGEQGDYIAVYSQDTLVEFQIDVTIYVGAEVNVNLELESEVYVSVEDFEQLAEELEQLEEEFNTHTHTTSDITDIDEKMLKLIYPVGTVLEFGSDTDPNSMQEWSGINWKWEPFAEGRVTVGKQTGDGIFGTVGTETGSRDAVVISHSHNVQGTAVASGMHGHQIDGSTNLAGAHKHTYGYYQDRAASGEARNTPGPNNAIPGGNYDTTQAPAHVHSVEGVAESNGQHEHQVSGTAAQTGVAGTNKNIQPSIVVSKWIRTA